MTLRPCRPAALTTVLRHGVAVVAWMACAAAAQAAPAAVDNSDAIARYLQDQGLVTSAPANAERSSTLMAQVRSSASDLVITAMNFLGVPYRRGGTTAEGGFDCSGFTRHVFEQSIGLLLPRRSADQAQSAGLMAVRREDLKPGDLVFFNTMRHAFSHVGIYVGDNKFIHSPRTGSEVRVEDMGESYWLKRFNGARRVPALSATGPAGADSPRP